MSPHDAGPIPLTRQHLHERSRLTDCTVALSFADTYFALASPWLRSGATCLHGETLVALGIVPNSKQGERLMHFLRERALVGSRSLGRIYNEPYKEALHGLRAFDGLLLPGGQDQLGKLLRLHRAEYARHRLFAVYIDEQGHQEKHLGRALARCTNAPHLLGAKGHIQRQLQDLQSNVAWAKKERDLTPSRRAANAHLLADPAEGCPLLPSFRQHLAANERSLLLYPPPPASLVAALAPPRYPASLSPQP